MSELKYNGEKYVVLEHRQGLDKGYCFYSMVSKNKTIDDFEMAYPDGPGSEKIRAYKVVGFVNSGDDARRIMDLAHTEQEQLAHHFSQMPDELLNGRDPMEMGREIQMLELMSKLKDNE